MGDDLVMSDPAGGEASSDEGTGDERQIVAAYNLASEGDHRARYFADKHASFPPDIDRDREKTYVFRV